MVLVGAGLTEERGEVARDVHGQVRAQRPGEDPHQAHPADVGVRGGLHHLGDQRPGGVAADLGRALAGRGVHLRAGVLGRRGEAGHDQVEQLGRAQPGARADRDHGKERTSGDSTLEVQDE